MVKNSAEINRVPWGRHIKKLFELSSILSASGRYDETTLHCRVSSPLRDDTMKLLLLRIVLARDDARHKESKDVDHQLVRNDKIEKSLELVTTLSFSAVIAG